MGITIYHTILADPPWPERGGGRICRGAQRHYDLMSVQDIIVYLKRIPVAKDAHLYLWATNNHLPDALEVMEAIGFDYKTNLAWLKSKDGGESVQIGLGQYFRGAHELLLFGTRGRQPYRTSPGGGEIDNPISDARAQDGTFQEAGGTVPHHRGAELPAIHGSFRQGAPRRVGRDRERGTRGRKPGNRTGGILMCEFRPKARGSGIDPCMESVVKFFEDWAGVDMVMCCCGHGVYPMTIIVRLPDGSFREIFSGATFPPGTKRFYRRDKNGMYYVPETLGEGPKTPTNLLYQVQNSEGFSKSVPAGSDFCMESEGMRK